MSRLILGIALALLIGTPAFADPPMTQADAFAAGNAAGDKVKRQANFDGMTATEGTKNVDGYASSAAESSYWSPTTPVSSLLSGGAAKVTSCSGAPSADPRIQNQCEAILALQKQPSIKPTGLVTPTDPIIVKGNAITANPEAIAGTMSEAYTACTTKTVSLGKDKTTETCDEYSSTGTVNCSIGTKVTVDADHLFKCLDTVHVVANTTCTVGRVVQVDADANYQCNENLVSNETLGCSKYESGAIFRAFDFTMGNQCSFIWDCVKRSISDATLYRRFEAAHFAGQDALYANGRYIRSTTVGMCPAAVGRGQPSYCNPRAIWPDSSKFRASPNAYNDLDIFSPYISFRAGTRLEMCGTANCTNAVPIMSGSDVIGYTCASTGNGTTCPAGFYSIGGTSCRSNSYLTYSGNPACTLVRSTATTIVGAASAMEYDFFCKSEDNQCAALEARAL